MSAPAETTMTETRRATLFALADVLIPAADGQLSASEADPNGKWLERALSARPDLVETSSACSTLPPDATRKPRPGASTPTTRTASGALATIVSGAYFMNLKVRKRIGFPGQGKRPPFSDEAEYDLRDGLLDPILGRAPSYQDPTPAFSTNGQVEPLPFTLSLSSDRADVLVIGAGAGGSVAARYLAEAGFRVVCLEQGDWANPVEFPGDKLEFELVSEAQWSPDPNVRRQPADYPLEISESPITPVMYNAVGGSTIHFCAQWVRMRPQDFKLRIARRLRRRLARLLRGDEALLRADRPGHADLGHVRRSVVPAGPGAGVTAPTHRPARTQGGGGHERARLALVARRTRDSLGSRREPRRLRAHRHVHVGLPQGSEELDRHDHVAEGARARREA